MNNPYVVRARGVLVVLALIAFLTPARGDSVRVSEQEITIPTYLEGEPEPNPTFYFGRNSQGAQGRVYPYPLHDSLTHVKSNKTYRIVYLENEYIRIGILPEIGGRLFEAVDKANGYHFVYRQHVIKPALIGLIGAWMSGGIEWNIPHHHRATTFLPVQYRVVENEDGSKTVWVGELELRDRMRWAVGYTLLPGRSYMTAGVRIANRTPFPNTMLCFANVAVHVDDTYQVIFPPRTRWVTFHAKREFARWPIASGPYAGADFGAGTDVSWYTNHATPNSMFAWNYEEDFFAGYDHGKQAGTMSVADHHFVPGKKFWTWGNGPRGRMWDNILTDNDGPYIELMVGAYSDNQPDYSWLQPFETKSFELHFYPFRDIGGVKNANLDAAVNLELTNGVARIGFCTTASHRAARVLLKAGEQVLHDEKIRITPTSPYLARVPVPPNIRERDLRLALSAGGKELISYCCAPALEGEAAEKAQERPKPYVAPPGPGEVQSIEELYLAGRRIEQFHAPGLDPEPYWEEALRRDAGDARVHLAFGVRRLKQARFAEAEAHLRKALARLSANHTTPLEGEPSYYLGVALKAQGRNEEAFDSFHKAAWSQAWRGPALYSLAEIAVRRGQNPEALRYVEDSLAANALNVRALGLKAAILRHSGRIREARATALAAAALTDPLDVRFLVERSLSGDRRATREVKSTFREHPLTALETAVEYGNAGLWEDGDVVLSLLEQAIGSKAPDAGSAALVLAYYYRAHFAERLGNNERAAEYRRRARQMPPDYVFPYQWEVAHVLRRAMEADPGDARAPYYLGNLLFDWQPEEAVELWEKSVQLDSSFPIAHRNLAVARSYQKPTNDFVAAIAHLERAVAASPKYALHFNELDELYAATGASPGKRLALLEQNHEVVVRRDDALSREIGLKVFAGKYDEAIRLMTGRRFSVWEGGSLEVAGHWVEAHLLRARSAIAKGDFARALKDLEQARALPENLPSDQRLGRRDAEIAYWTAIAREGLGQADKARESWETSAKSVAEMRGRPGAGERRLSEAQVQDCFRAMSLLKLVRPAEAEALFKSALELANKQMTRGDSGEAASQNAADARRHALGLAHYTAGLAHLGLGDHAQARHQFDLALQASPDFVRAKAGLTELKAHQP